jgi:hypothetical protein
VYSSLLLSFSTFLQQIIIPCFCFSLLFSIGIIKKTINISETMDFRISEYDSAIAMPRDDDVSSILAPTATLLKALEEFSDDEDECQYKKEEKEVNTVKCEFSFQSEEQDLESKKSTFFVSYELLFI